MVVEKKKQKGIIEKIKKKSKKREREKYRKLDKFEKKDKIKRGLDRYYRFKKEREEDE